MQKRHLWAVLCPPLMKPIEQKHLSILMLFDMLLVKWAKCRNNCFVLPPQAKKVKKEDVKGAPRTKKEKQEQDEVGVWRWWEEEKRDDGIKWNFLEHKGPVFAPAYEPLPPDIKFYYEGLYFFLNHFVFHLFTLI